MKFQNGVTIVEQSDLIQAMQHNLINDYGREYTQRELNDVLDCMQLVIEDYLKLPKSQKCTDYNTIKVLPYSYDGSLSLESYLDNGGTRILNGVTIKTEPRIRVRARYSNYFKRRIMNELKK